MSNLTTTEVRHTLTPAELLDIFNAALQYAVDGSDPDNMPIIRRSHEALSRTFENGKRRGYQEGFAAAFAHFERGGV